MKPVNYQQVLEEIAVEVAPLRSKGRVVDYVPPLARVTVDQFGMALRTVDGRVFTVGASAQRFSVQSIAKLVPLTLAMKLHGDAVWQRVGREPSGSAFNSLIQLELERGIPRNPFINAGALVTLDLTLSAGPRSAIDDFFRAALGTAVTHDAEVAAGEARTGHRNRALAHFLKSFDNLRNDADAVLDAYFELCAISLSCEELAHAFTYLANGGVGADGAVLATARQAKRINAVMLTCGVYDEAGDYAYRVGLPAKSGVGGGVVAVMPGQYTVAVWSPGLDARGNSLAGTMALELLTTKTAVSVF
jgi:glutaminase